MVRVDLRAGSCSPSSVTFQDVAACFQEDAWEEMEEPQRDLYRNAMKEIHRALRDLGEGLPLLEAMGYYTHCSLCRIIGLQLWRRGSG